MTTVSTIKVLQFNPTGTPDKYTITAPFPNEYKRDVDKGILSQAGDVLSVQPDGSLQTRPQGTEGPFELCSREGLIGVYQINETSPIYLIAPEF